ncbi:MAG: response regulator [Candidatus Riflebacteria bacterium]|nr:response regulator [Candidatus Riflebacteria bacterium]
MKPLILIVDDAPLSLKMAAEILGNKGYRLALADGGASALRFIDENRPDLILLDIIMPEIDGFAICEKLKSSSNTAAIPVIFLTGRAGNGDVTKSYQLGGADYLVKPFNSAEMLVKVKTHLELALLKKTLRQSLSSN